PAPAPAPARWPRAEQPATARPKRTGRTASAAEKRTGEGAQPPASMASAAQGPTGNAPPAAEPEPIPVVDGIAVVYGYGVKVRVERGHLFVADGICADRRAAYLNRATSGLRHLVVLGHTGSISVDAFKWLHALGAAVTMIDADGEVIFASAPSGADEAHLRRAQALAAFSDAGFDAMRFLLTRKVQGQARNLRALGNDEL